MRPVLSKTTLVVGAALSAALTLTTPASAAAPTRVVDETAQVICTGVEDDVELTVRASRSDSEGTSSALQLSYASTGERIGGGEGTSDWGDGTFRALVPATGQTEEPIGEVYFAGTYAPSGDPVRTVNRFKDANIHVVEDHTETPVALSNVVVQYGDLTFDDLRCEGGLTSGSLFFTNPATRVDFGSFLGYECTGTNVAKDSASIEGTLDELFVNLTFADRPDASVGGLVRASGDSWQSEFNLQIADEPAGTVAATGTLVRSGNPANVTDGKKGMRSHAQVTPYRFTLTVAGPDAPASLTCTLQDVRQKLHSPNTA